MEKIKKPLIFTTVYLFLHTLSPYLNVPAPVIMASLALSPLLVIWLVVRVLKDGVSTQETFEEHFYEDIESKRVQGRKID